MVSSNTKTNQQTDTEKQGVRCEDAVVTTVGVAASVESSSNQQPEPTPLLGITSRDDANSASSIIGGEWHR